MANITQSKSGAIKIKTRAAKLFLATDQHAQEVPKELVELCQEIAKQEGIPITGLTILGGKPYINVTGLDSKIKNKCNEEQLILVGVKAELIQHASEENKFKAGYKGIVQFFNERGFLAALEKLDSPDITAIEKLKEMYTYSFQDEGWASPQSVRMSTLHSTDIINMMASRRATNRAKRLATGCGLTSIEEIGIDSAILERTVEPSQSISIEERIKRMRRQMFKDAKEIGLEPTQIQQEIKERFGKTSSKDLNEEELSEILQWLEEQKVESPKMQSDAIARDLINMMREAQDLEALKQIKRRARTVLHKLRDEDKEEVDRMYWQRMKELKQDQEIIEEGDDDE